MYFNRIIQNRSVRELWLSRDHRLVKKNIIHTNLVFLLQIAVGDHSNKAVQKCNLVCIT